MKKIKNTFLIGLLLLVIAFASALAIPHTATNNSADAVAGTVSKAFDYVTLTQSGQVLNLSNLKTWTDDSGTVTRSIISNKNTSFNFKPLEYNYKIWNQNESSDLTYFETHQETVTFTATTKTDDTGEWIFSNNNFAFDGQAYTYKLTADGQVEIYKVATVAQVTPVVRQSLSDLITFSETEDAEGTSATRTISFTTTITPRVSQLSSKQFNFQVLNTEYSFIFEQPITNFTQNAPFTFNSVFDNSGNPDNSKATNFIPPEQTFFKQQISFINNNYTESNPLYFNINHNGFVYEFELYSKEFSGTKYLFVNYYDEDKTISSNITNENQKRYAKTTYLATPLTLDIENKFTIDSTDASKLVNAVSNDFALYFRFSGRYEIEFFDSTYLLGIENSNYYKQSFYIREDNGSDASINNIYIVAESLDDDGNHLEYIVSGAVLNNDIQFSIKNIANDKDILDKIIITKTIFGNEENVPVHTTYTVSDLLEQLTNGDFVMFCNEDASYTIDIYEKGNNNPISYQYIVLKHPKSHFSDPTVGSYSEQTPYTKTIRNYTKTITNQMKLDIRINNNAIQEDANITLSKTFIDKFQVIYGKIQVDTQKVVQYDDEGKEIKSDAKTYQFYGVGDITVTINYNGTITTKIIKQDEDHTITFSEYGTYEVQMKDEMGTQLTTPLTFKVSKSLNTSAIILIVLISIVVLAVAAFIIFARSKVSTR